jgi:hypothetical protein
MEQHGEIDIVVLNQAGDVLLIEVKAGDVDFREDGIFKHYRTQSKDVVAQARLQYNGLLSRLRASGFDVHLHHLLVLPDMRVQSDTAQWPRERIVDSSDVNDIVSRVTVALGPGVHDEKTNASMVAFFENRFRVVPDVSALAGRLQSASTRMAAGLATWVPRIDVPNGIIRVFGTAGSGKTQLALRVLRDARADGRKAAYICFNRALADHMAHVAPVTTPVETFHEFALRGVRASGVLVDFSKPKTFELIAGQCVEQLKNAEPDLDFLVLDEVQDLQPDWVQAMLGRLRPNGRALLLEDPEQQLYTDRESFDIPDAVTIRSSENFRTPRALVRLINMLNLTAVEVEPLSAHEGEIADPIVYVEPEMITHCTVKAIQNCLDRGFAPDEIAIVSLRGRERSVLQSLDSLGPWTLRRFTGRYDEGGSALWTNGQILIDSVRRFKGQAAAAVVLTECDLDGSDEIGRRLLFVGLTRARVHLEWVMSGAAARWVESRLLGSGDVAMPA